MRTAVVLAMALVGAAGQGEPRALAGTWVADFAGRTFVRLELHETNGTWTGRISLGDIHVNVEGEIDDVTEVARNFTPILDIVFRDGALSFARKDGDDKDLFVVRQAGDALQLIFTPTDEDRRQLTAAGLPIPKPVLLKRAR